LSDRRELDVATTTRSAFRRRTCRRERRVNGTSVPKQGLSRGKLYAPLARPTRREAEGKTLGTSARQIYVSHARTHTVRREMAFISSTLILKRVPTLVNSGNAR
jgi:hypothetical protein